MNTNARYAVLIIEVQRLDTTSGREFLRFPCPVNFRNKSLENPLLNDEERTHWIVAR